MVDALTFGGATLLGLAVCGFVQKYDHPSDWLLAADLLLGMLACLSLWWRRSHPLTVALLALPAVAVSSSFFGAGIVITVNLALRLPWRRSLAVLGLYLVASALGGLLLAGWETDGLAGVAFALGYYLGSFAWGSTLRARRLWTLAVRREADLERKEHVQRLADIRRDEREAIAREMHDVLAHRISLLSVHAGALAYRAEQSAAGTGRHMSDTEILQSSQIIRDNAHQAVDELQDVLLVLRTEVGVGEPMAPQPSLADVPKLVDEARAAGQKVDFHNELAGHEANPPRPQSERTVYRVVQEGLTNARKHAPRAKVSVRLSGEPGSGLVVEISNRMPATWPRREIPGTGTGLAGLAERVRLDGGLLEYGSDGQAFTLQAQLLWPVR
ncbi:histidine kinase [Streptomyces actuosus]|uniref:histidine kinase n=2 Tax=Streptomyces actuosus TaxID=1885 RepID=A0ABS2VZB5_STRAS|nr:histidine kinase [Streptomyces actuosus]